MIPPLQEVTRKSIGVDGIASTITMQALAALSLSLAPSVRVTAPFGGRVRPASMIASLEAPSTAPKSFDELDMSSVADRTPQRARTLAPRLADPLT